MLGRYRLQACECDYHLAERCRREGLGFCSRHGAVFNCLFCFAFGSHLAGAKDTRFPAYFFCCLKPDQNEGNNIEGCCPRMPQGCLMISLCTNGGKLYYLQSLKSTGCCSLDCFEQAYGVVSDVSFFNFCLTLCRWQRQTHDMLLCSLQGKRSLLCMSWRETFCNQKMWSLLTCSALWHLVECPALRASHHCQKRQTTRWSLRTSAWKLLPNIFCSVSKYRSRKNKNNPWCAHTAGKRPGNVVSVFVWFQEAVFHRAAG